MELANATCASVIDSCQENSKIIRIKQMDAEELAWLVVFGVPEDSQVFVENVSCSFDPSRFMKGTQKRQNIHLQKPEQEFLQDIFSEYVEIIP